VVSFIAAKVAGSRRRTCGTVVPVIRRARPLEAPLLSDLALRSKAHWGYTREFLDACRDELRVSAEDLEAHPTFVLESDDRLLGFYTLEHISPDAVELGHLFVEPDAIGAGLGLALVAHARDEARQRGYRKIVIQADPHAEGFYRAIGARKVGTRASSSIPGRELPLLEVSLAE
jgi:GNAT superfamily N-acetyltransferase